MYGDCVEHTSVACLGGVKGDDWLEALVARLVVRVRGDGVRGMRPPATRVEKMPWWLLAGVDTDADAIVLIDRLDNLMCRSFL